MLKYLKWYIYCIYGVFSGYIPQYSPSTSDFCRPRSNPSGGTPCPRARRAAFGIRPRTKKILGFGAILWDIALEDPIYTLHIYYNIY